MITLNINEDHRWFIMKAIEYFTSDESSERFLNEFPDVDQERLNEVFEEIITIFEKTI